MRFVATFARLALAVVFGYAALAKITDPAGSVRAVRAYELLPPDAATVVGRGLPALELALALLLLTGLALRLTASVAAGLLTVFLAGIVSAAARGLQIDCGCFGGGGATTDPSYTWDIVRDVALLAIAVLTVVVGRSRFALGPALPLQPDPVDPSASGAERRRQRTELHRYETALARHGRLSRWAAAGSVAALLLSGGIGVGVASVTAPAPPTAVPAGVTAAGGIFVGAAEAPRTVVLFEDPQCPVCREFEEGSGKVLQEAVARGEVRVEYRMRSFLGPESVRAVAALGAAQDEGRFEQLREALFAHQPQERTGGFTVEDLVELGASVGLTSDAFTTAVRDQTYAAWARQVDDRASRDGNTGTPQLLLDGTPVDAKVVFDPAALREALAAAP